MSYCIVTGSGGLVGSETVRFFSNIGYNVVGIDNDMRKYFFNTSTQSITDILKSKYSNFTHYNIDIRKKDELETNIFKKLGNNIKCIVHCAAQPSHDWAAKEPHTDFEVNAVATLNLLELTRKYCQKASFIFMSTNKVYGDNPNRLDIEELETRWELKGRGSIDENMSVDHCKHSLFGVSKLAADAMVQEYGRYFNMNTVCFRGGCITGPNHQGAELHGFLSYIVKCIVTGKHYKIFGYKGKQVRDNIHSYDLVNAFWNYHQNPRPGAVYNMGGGRDNSLSILETIDLVNDLTDKKWKNYELLEEARAGDHIWYISDLSKFKKDYPNWNITYSVKRIIQDIICSISPQTMTANLQGGIGNQMFQIAAAYAMSRKLNYNLLFKLNQFSGCRQGKHPSTYYSNIFQSIHFTDNFPAINTIITEISWTAYPLLQHIKNTTAGNNKSICLNGYYQSDYNWKEYTNEIKQLFTPDGGIISYLKNNTDIFEKYPELSKPHDFAFLGVRRGDYITYADFHNPCGMTYYSKALHKMQKDRYYIITDDTDWCKKKFVGDKYVFMDIKEDKNMLLTMALFKNYIISNSTFYWWGSFLSIYENIQIIAPDKWVFGNAPKDKYWSIYREGMDIIERPVEIN
tara:strand:- start:2828 stop:4714 length:1887 start_codon:yes stop_codon:yes gene_type:complete